MIKQEIVIKMFITTDDVSNERADFHYIVNGINNLSNIIDCLHFNESESIYVHLESPVSPEQMNHELMMLCKHLIDEGHVNTANFGRMGLPMEGGRFNTTIGDNNMLTNERYMITCTK